MIVGGIALGVLVLLWFVIGRVCSAAECIDYYCPSDRKIEAPEGYEFVSRIFSYNPEKGAVSAGNDLAIAVELTKPVPDGAALSFYRYIDETKNWEPISPAVLDSQGKVVSATFSGTPSLMAVMRRNSPVEASSPTFHTMRLSTKRRPDGCQSSIPSTSSRRQMARCRET